MKDCYSKRLKKMKKLKNFESIVNLALNKMYQGKVLPNKLVSLNKTIKCKVKNSDEMPSEGDVAVKITKISLPANVECQYVPGTFELEEENYDIGKIYISDVGRTFDLNAKIVQIIQTSGPTLFTLFDGSGSIKSKHFIGAGKRAFPELNENDVIRAKIQITERDGRLEAELLSFKKLEDSKQEKFILKVQSLKDEKARPKDVDFLINSEILVKLKPKIIEVATQIKKAILEHRPIILRHHADTDGYAGAIALERAILPLIVKQHNDEKAAWFYYKRGPSKAPFYELVDVTKDLAFALSDVARHGRKIPLIVLVDNGSTEEDILAIEKAKIYGAPVVVVDHHYPGIVKDGKVKVDEYLDAHANPYLVGGDNNLTAGMLAVEVSRFVNPNVKGVEYLPALAGVGDRSKGAEMDQYLALSGYDVETLREIGTCIDFEAHYLRFVEARIYVDDLLGADKEKQKKLVALATKEIARRVKEQMKVIKHFVKVTEGETILAELPATSVGFRGDFPAAGRITGMCHDYVCEQHPGKGVVTLGIGPDFLTIRANDNVNNFNINLIIDKMKEVIPYGFIDGGGHEHAGTIKCVEAVLDEVLEFVRKSL